MGSYTVLQWTTFFMLYCMFGWCFESTYCSIKSGHLQNRGFCHGPWLPIYGVGATLLLLITEGHEGSRLYLFLVGFFGGTCLELVTGFLMNKIFHMRWWDYSQNPLNFHGYICLPASIGWGFAAIFVIQVVHPRIASIPETWSYITFVVMNSIFYTLFVEDVIISVIAALELKERVTRLAANSEEIQLLRKSIAEVYEKLADTKAEWEQSAEEIREVQKAEGSVAAAKLVASSLKNSVVAVAGNVKDSAEAIFSRQKTLVELEKAKTRLEERLSLLEDGGNENSGKMPWWVKTMLRNNPDAVSEANGFDDLKKAALKPLKDIKQHGNLYENRS